MAVEKKVEILLYLFRGSALESIFSDVITLLVLGFLIWISRDSTAWTLLCGLIAISHIYYRGSRLLKISENRFSSVEEAQAYLNRIKAPEDQVG